MRVLQSLVEFVHIRRAVIIVQDKILHVECVKIKDLYLIIDALLLVNCLDDLWENLIDLHHVM